MQNHHLIYFAFTWQPDGLFIRKAYEVHNASKSSVRDYAQLTENPLKDKCLYENTQTNDTAWLIYSAAEHHRPVSDKSGKHIGRKVIVLFSLTVMMFGKLKMEYVAAYCSAV